MKTYLKPCSPLAHSAVMWSTHVHEEECNFTKVYFSQISSLLQGMIFKIKLCPWQPSPSRTSSLHQPADVNICFTLRYTRAFKFCTFQQQF